MKRKFIFKDGDREFQLPVTPPSFSVEHGVRIETINIHTIGDVNIAGYGTLAALKIDCMFPSTASPFAVSDQDPYTYVDYFLKWCDARTVLRFVVSDTPVNISVLIESINYSEQDGTNDVYATISLREYRELSAVKVEKVGSGNKNRVAAIAVVTKASSYTIQKGDTLGSICRKFYGDASLYPKLAAANGIKNPNLIITGQTLKMPEKSQLTGGRQYA